MVKLNFYNILMTAYVFCFLTVSCSNDDDIIETGNGIAFGTVVDRLTNEPLEGASVTLYPGGRTIVTGMTGQYEFRGLNPGGYLVQVAKSGYLSATQAMTVQNGTNAQSDMSLAQGESCLDVMIGDIFFDTNTNSKVFVVSNVGNKKIDWNLYTDYNRILSFDVTSGTLEPGQSQAVSVTMNRSLVNNDLTSFPIYVYANGEELGVIATVDRATVGYNNSLLVGEWRMETMYFVQDNEVWFNSYEGNELIYNFLPDYTVEMCSHRILNSDGDVDLDGMFNYSYSKCNYDYDFAKNVLILDPEYVVRGNIYRVNILTENTLELETLNTLYDYEWRVLVFRRN